jgi:hypothetical protein
MLENLPGQLGHLLQGQRAGLEKIALYRLLAQRTVQRLLVHSSAFEHLASIPPAYTADCRGCGRSHAESAGARHRREPACH